MITELTDNNFDEFINNHELVIVDFWAPWCMPCRMMAPVFEELSNEIKKVKFAKINTAEHARKASEHGVMGIPCLIIFRNGEEIKRLVGYMPKSVLKQKIEECV